MATSASFEIDSYIKGYHVYKDIWTPELHVNLKAVPEPTNLVDKYAVCVLRHETIVGHLKLGTMDVLRKQSFTICELTHVTRALLSLKGKLLTSEMETACKSHVHYSFVGKVKFIEVLQKELLSVQNDYQKKQC